MEIIFINLEIHNFKQLVNTNIDFGYAPQVTLIYGANGTGKSTLSEAIQWLWTGGAINTSQGETLPENLFSTYEPDTTTSYRDKMSVSLQLQTDSKRYQITRTWTKNDKVDGLLQVKRIDDEATWVRDGVQAQSELEKMIPGTMLQEFFMFDGARLQTYSSLLKDAGRQQSIGIQLQKLLGLDIVSTATKALESMKMSYSREMTKTEGKTEEVTKKQQQLGELLDHKEAKDLERKTIEVSQGEWEAKYEKYRAIVEEDKSLAELKQQMATDDADHEALLQRIHEQRREILSHSEDLWKYLLQDTEQFHDLEKRIHNQSEQLTLQNEKEYKHQMRKLLLRTHVCDVCTSTISQDKKDEISSLIDDYESKEEEILDKSQSESPHTIELKHIYEITRDLPSTSTEIQKKEEDLDNNIDNLQKIEQRRRTYNRNSVAQSDEEEDPITAMTDAFSKSEEQKKLLETYEEDAKANTDAVERLNRELGSLNQNDKEWSELQHRQKRAELITKVFQNAYEELKKVTTKSISDHATDAIHQLMPQYSMNFNKIEVDPDFSINIKDEYGNDVKGPSSAQNVCLALSVYRGIQEQALIQAPFIFDSAFVNLDENMREPVAKYMSDINGQVVILHHDGE